MDLYRLPRPGAGTPVLWRRRDQAQALAGVAVLTILAAIMPVLLPLGHRIWLTITLTGVIAAGVALLAAIVALVVRLIVTASQWRECLSSPSESL